MLRHCLPGHMALYTRLNTRKLARCWLSKKCLLTPTCRKSSKKLASCSSVTVRILWSTTAATSRTLTYGFVFSSRDAVAKCNSCSVSWLSICKSICHCHTVCRNDNLHAFFSKELFNFCQCLNLCFKYRMLRNICDFQTVSGCELELIQDTAFLL